MKDLYRKGEIDNENQLLVEKISHILTHKASKMLLCLCHWHCALVPPRCSPSAVCLLEPLIA